MKGFRFFVLLYLLSFHSGLSEVWWHCLCCRKMQGPGSKQTFDVKKSVSLASSQVLPSVTISEGLRSSTFRNLL